MKAAAYERAMAREAHREATSAVPTCKLRYVLRWRDLAGEVPMLQQWWEWHEHGYGHDEVHGEWRDVPIERETTGQEQSNG